MRCHHFRHTPAAVRSCAVRMRLAWQARSHGRPAWLRCRACAAKRSQAAWEDKHNDPINFNGSGNADRSCADGAGGYMPGAAGRTLEEDRLDDRRENKAGGRKGKGAGATGDGTKRRKRLRASYGDQPEHDSRELTILDRIRGFRLRRGPQAHLKVAVSDLALLVALRRRGRVSLPDPARTPAR